VRRLILFLLWAGLLIVIAVVVADHEGAVSVEWLGYRIDTSTSVVLLGLAVVAVASALFYRVWRAVATAPRRWRRARALRRRERGYRALTLGLVAAAAGDRAEAQRQSRRTSGLLEGQPLALMLAAQAAQLGGDDAAARRLFDQMLAHPDTAFLGLRGLIAAALDSGDHRAALDYAARARALSPDAPWLLDRLFELHAGIGDWTAAAAVAERAAKLRALDGPEAQRRRALAALGQADAAEAEGRLDAAIRHARAAVAATPGAVPAVARLARLLLVAGRHRDAAKLIEQAWPAAAHPELAALYGQAIEEADPLARVKRFERLVKRAPDEAEGHVALAEAALLARLWGEAREHFERAAQDPATRSRAYRGLAEIEERERHDRERALDWRTRAAAAPPAPFWLCARCDRPAQAWSVRCLHCNAPGTLTWHQPVAGAISAVDADAGDDAGGVIDAVVVEPDEAHRLADQRLAALAQAAGGARSADPPTR
jgi:HemY protein